LVEGNTLVRAIVLWQAQHLFGDRISQDLVGTAGNANGRRLNPCIDGVTALGLATVIDKGIRTHQVHGGCGEAQAAFRNQQLADCTLRARLVACGNGFHGPTMNGAQSLPLHQGICQQAANLTILQRRSAADTRPGRELNEALTADSPTGFVRDGIALDHQRLYRHLETTTDLAHALAVRHIDVVEEDFIDLALACQLADRPHLNAFAFHIENETIAEEGIQPLKQFVKASEGVLDKDISAGGETSVADKRLKSKNADISNLHTDSAIKSIKEEMNTIKQFQIHQEATSDQFSDSIVNMK
ncbi:predicted protein, partial [Trichoplax adhaerens]